MKQNNQVKVLNRFIKTITDELGNKAPKFSGKLSKSFVGSFEVNSNGFTVAIDGLNYATFLDKGVNGSEISYGSPYTFKGYPNIGAITPYADAIGISPYALANSMYRKGIKPRGFITDNIDDDTTKLGDEIIEGLWEDFYDDNKTPDK